MKRIFAIAIVTLMICGVFSGCENKDKELKSEVSLLEEDSSFEASSIREAMGTPSPTLEPTPSPTPSQTPTPEPTPEVLDTDLPMLKGFGENYMQPRPLGDIDPINDKVVALTFDDGPHGECTDILLETLKKHDVVATFFVLGQNAGYYPDVVKRTYDAGHEIGTHSYDHPNLMGYSVSGILDSYSRSNDNIEAAIGLRAIIDRPPYGSMTEEVAQQVGRTQAMWTVDPEDWRDEYKSTDSLVSNVMYGTNSGVPVRDGAIILSHDIYYSTVNAYDSIIAELKNDGYKFVTVTQMMQIAEKRGEEVPYMFRGA